jgi:hypothetical protein
MTKEEEIMEFLNAKVFGPVLSSLSSSQELKTGIRYTIMRLNERDAKGMVSYFWSAISGTERSIGFSAKLKKEGFNRFEEAIEEFRVRFDDRWLRKK